MVVLSDKGGCAAKLYLESKDITFSESTKATGWIIKESRPKGSSSSLAPESVIPLYKSTLE